MTTIANVTRFVVDTVILAGLAFIALVVYAMYTSDTELLTAIHCHMKYDSEFGRNACMFVNSNN